MAFPISFIAAGVHVNGGSPGIGLNLSDSSIQESCYSRDFSATGVYVWYIKPPKALECAHYESCKLYSITGLLFRKF